MLEPHSFSAAIPHDRQLEVACKERDELSQAVATASKTRDEACKEKAEKEEVCRKLGLTLKSLETICYLSWLWMHH